MSTLTTKQIDWSRKHDWFAGVSAQGVSMRETVRRADGTSGSVYATYSDFASLRNAAGY